MFDFDSFRISYSSEVKHTPLFKTDDKYEYDVYPCASLFSGKHRSGKSIYLPYAVSRWKNGEEAFGLVPKSEIRPVCFASNRGDIIDDKVIDYINPFKKGRLSYKDFSQFIQDFCEQRSYNVIFIENFRTLCSKLSGIDKKETLIGDFFSGLSLKLGIYIFVVMNSSKTTDAITGSYYGASCITATTDAHIDLSFDWRTKNIERRVMFGNALYELNPESESSLSKRLEEIHFQKYGGYESLIDILFPFRYKDETITNAQCSVGISSRGKVHGLIVLAKEDGYLDQKNPRSSYSLTKKGHELFGEVAGCVSELISESEYKKFCQFYKETEGIDYKYVSATTIISKAMFSEWETWKMLDFSDIPVMLNDIENPLNKLYGLDI